MAAETVRIVGLREFQRAMREMEGSVSKELRVALLEAARPVAEAARAKLSRYRGASLDTIVPRASVRGAFVTQQQAQVTGLRKDFGVLEMTRGFEPALAENYSQILASAGGAIDLLSSRHGF